MSKSQQTHKYSDILIAAFSEPVQLPSAVDPYPPLAGPLSVSTSPSANTEVGTMEKTIIRDNNRLNALFLNFISIITPLSNS